MEVKTFIESQINPLMLVFQFLDIRSHYLVSATGLMNSGLWKQDSEGLCYIPNLMSIDIGFGYDINVISPDDASYYDRPVISLITVIPDSFYTQDLSVSLTKDVATTIENQVMSFFNNCNIKIKLNDKITVEPYHEMQTKAWSYQLIHGAKIVAVERNGNLLFEVIYG